MSLGDLVIGFSADTARFQADMGKAAQMLEKFGSIAKLNTKSAQDAIKGLSDEGVSNILRLQRSFNALNIKSQLQIDFEKNKLIAHFEAIKNSGVASMNEIARAKAALDYQLNKLETGSGKSAEHMENMRMSIFASVGMIAKMQIMFSLVNSTMSAIANAPSIAVSAIEDFNSSAINNAAMITSMQTGVKDIGKAYQENKIYSEAVQNVLVKMDAETAASAKNLRDMNNQFVQQGVLIDVNNTKQVEGFKSVANALAAITAGDPNQAMQYSQEIRALKTFEDKGSNRLVQMLRAQGVTKEMYEQWKASGTVLEEMKKRLEGFAAAQGDINNLWATTKSTMETIRDEVLRGGLSEGFAEIVKFMKQISSEAEKNKEKIQAFIKETFVDVKNITVMFYEAGKGLSSIGNTTLWTAVSFGIGMAIASMRTFVSEITIATGGINLLAGAFVAWGLSTGKELKKDMELLKRVENINKINKTPNSVFNTLQLRDVLKDNPLASDSDIAKWIKVGAINPENNTIQQMAINAMKNDKDPVKIPKGVTVSSDDKVKTFPEWNSFVQAFSSGTDNSEPDNFDRKIAKINTFMKKMRDNFKNSEMPKEQKEWIDSLKEAGQTPEQTMNWIEEHLKNRAKEEELLKIKPIEDAFNKATAKEEINPLQKQLKLINAELVHTINMFEKLSKLDKDALNVKGINKDTLEKVFGGVKERITTEENIKRAKELNDEKINLNRIKTSTPNMWGQIDPKIALKNQYDDEISALKEKMKKEEELYGMQTEKYKNFLQQKEAMTTRNSARLVALETQQWMEAGSIVANQLGQVAGLMDKSNKRQFEQWKALAIGQATISTALAVAGILGSESLKSFGIAVPLAITAGMIGAAQIAKIAATPYQAREFGGPVTAGQSYIVGEKRPELFTPGASGVITPYVPSSQQGLTVSPVFQISTGVAETAQAEIMRYAPSLIQLTVDAVKDAINSGGEMSMAVGRM